MEIAAGHKRLDYLGWSAMIISLVLMRLANDYVENIIRGMYFLLMTGLAGLLLASAWIWFLYRHNRHYFIGGERRASALLCHFFSVLFLSIFFAAFLNFHTGKSRAVQDRAYVISKSVNARYRTHFVFLDINGRRGRFIVDASEFILLKENDTTTIRTAQGLLGFKYILKFAGP